MLAFDYYDSGIALLTKFWLRNMVSEAKIFHVEGKLYQCAQKKTSALLPHERINSIAKVE